LFHKILKTATTTAVTKEYILTALMKLTDRFSSASTDRLKQMIANFQNNIEVELQQRSCEYSKLFAWDNVRKNLLERIPIVEEKKEQTAPQVHIKATQSGGSLIEIWDDNTSPVPQPRAPTQPITTPAPGAPPGGALDIMAEIFGGPAPVAQPVKAAPAVDPLLDLLGGPVSSPAVSPLVGLNASPVITPIPMASPVSPVMGATPVVSPVNGSISAFSI